MSNFKVKISEELLTKVDLIADKSGKSVNDIVIKLLDNFVKYQSYPMNGNFEILFNYSLGKLSAKKTVKLLHMQDQAALHSLTLKAGLPLPRHHFMKLKLSNAGN